MLLPALLLLIPPVLPPLQVTVGGALAELADKQDPYPAERPKTRTLSFIVDSDADVAAAKSALTALAAPDAPCRIVNDLEKSAAQPKSAFVVVEAPVTRDAKEVVAALRKTSKHVDRLACTAFDSDPTAFTVGMNTPRDQLLASSSEVRRATAWGRTYQLYTASGKGRTDQLGERLAKFVHAKKAPPVVKSSFAWPLAEPVDAAAAKRAEKLLLAIPGIGAAHVDPTKHVLEVSVDLEGLDVLGAPFMISAEDLAKTLGTKLDAYPLPKARFDTTPVFDALEHEKLTLAPRAEKAK